MSIMFGWLAVVESTVSRSTYVALTVVILSASFVITVITGISAVSMISSSSVSVMLLV